MGQSNIHTNARTAESHCLFPILHPGAISSPGKESNPHEGVSFLSACHNLLAGGGEIGHSEL